MSKTVLFFPVEVGLAHTTHALAVAEALMAKGHEAIIALPKRKQSIFASSPVPFIDIPGLSENESMEGITEVLRARQFRHHIVNEIKLIKEIHPDAVCIDFRYTAMISAIICDAPIFSINNSTSLPTWYQIPPYNHVRFLRPLYAPIVNWGIQQIKNQILSKMIDDAQSLGYDIEFGDILEKPHYIIPEHKNYFCAQVQNLNTTYVPPLEWKGFEREDHNWLRRLSSKSPVIYLSFGGTGFDAMKMVSIAETLIDQGFQVIVSVGTLISPHEFKTHPHLHVHRFIDPKKVLKHVDILICHGGYGTITEAVRQHVPFISIPFNPEQVMHALRTQELGMSESLARFSPADLISLARQDWSAFEDIGRKVSTEKVIEHVHKILQNYEKYQSKLRQYSYMFSETSGAQAAAETIINTCEA